MRRVAVLGAGIGAAHVVAFAVLPDLFRVHTVCDRDTSRAREIAPPDALIVDDLNTVLDDPDIDIVDICLPSHLHTEVSLKAMAAGKHVICEKPVAASLKDVDRLIAAEGPARMFPVFQYRYGLGTAQVEALQNADLAGRFFAATLETHWNRDAAYYSVPWRGTWAGEQGGVLVTHAIHIHDLLVALLGPVQSVSAHTATRVNDIETEDCAALSVTMENGGLITSSATLGAATDTSRLRLMFEHVTVESDHAPYAPAAKGWRFTARGKMVQEKIDRVVQSVVAPSSGYVGLFTEIARALSNQNHRAITLSDARQSAEFITAAYGSAASGARMSLPLSDTDPGYEDWRASTSDRATS